MGRRCWSSKPAVIWSASWPCWNGRRGCTLTSPVVLAADGDQPELAGLAWDLGAAYVLLPPQPRERLPEIVAGLMGEKAEAKKA